MVLTALCPVCALLLILSHPATAQTQDSSNDNFENAFEIQLNTPLQTLISSATLEPGEPQAEAYPGTIWYFWTAPSDGNYHVSISFRPGSVAVFTGDKVSELTALPLLTNNGYDFGFRAVTGTTYRIRAAIRNPDTPLLNTALIESGPPDDDFARATSLEGTFASWYSHTFGAGSETEEPPGMAPQHASTWARWTAPDSRTYRVIPYPELLALQIFEGQSLESLALVAGPSAGFVGWQAKAGHIYYIRADTAAAAPAYFSMRLGPAPENDDFANATPLEGSAVHAVGSTWTATRSEVEFYFPGIWWKWTAPADGLLNARGSPLVRVLHTRWPTISSNLYYYVPFGDQSAETSSTLRVSGGVEYRFCVGAAPSTNAVFDLSFTLSEPLPLSWRELGFFRGGYGRGGWGVETNDTKVEAQALEATHPGWLEAVLPGPGTLEFWMKSATDSRHHVRFWYAVPGQSPSYSVLTNSANWAFRQFTFRSATNLLRLSLEADSDNLPWPTNIFCRLDGVKLTMTPPLPPKWLPPVYIPGAGLVFPLRGEVQRSYQVDTSMDLVRWNPLQTLFFRDRDAANFTLPPSDPPADRIFLRATVK